MPCTEEAFIPPLYILGSFATCSCERSFLGPVFLCYSSVCQCHAILLVWLVCLVESFTIQHCDTSRISTCFPMIALSVENRVWTHVDFRTFYGKHFVGVFEPVGQSQSDSHVHNFNFVYSRAWGGVPSLSSSSAFLWVFLIVNCRFLLLPWLGLFLYMLFTIVNEVVLWFPSQFVCCWLVVKLPIVFWLCILYFPKRAHQFWGFLLLGVLSHIRSHHLQILLLCLISLAKTSSSILHEQNIFRENILSFLHLL